MESLRSSVNQRLSHYEPLTLLLTPVLASLLVFVVTPSLAALLAELQHRGWKATCLPLMMALLQMVPAVNEKIRKQKEEVVNKMRNVGKSGRENWLSELPEKGLGVDVLDRLSFEKSKDAAWHGRSSGAVYLGGNETEGHFNVLNAAYAMIVPESAHSAYDKAAEYFKIKLWRAPVNKEFQADVKSIKRLVNRNTILIVGSAPGFPHGIIDPIEELGALALKKKVCFHVDLCLGGFVLPFARKLGYPIPVFDFTVSGVTSISVDIHKYGLGPKGTSIVLYRNHEIRRHQFVAVTEWSGGLYISPSMAGSRPGALIAGAWASLISFGMDGYMEAVQRVMQASEKLKKGISEISDLYIIGKPDMTIIAFASQTIDIYKVNDAMSARGWNLNALHKPSSLHICITLQHVNTIEEFLKDLTKAVKMVKENPGSFEDGLAPIYGAAAKMPDRGMVKDLLLAYMDNAC